MGIAALTTGAPIEGWIRKKTYEEDFHENFGQSKIEKLPAINV